jgi:acetyl esterase
MTARPHHPRHPLDPVAEQIAAAMLLDDNWVNMTSRPAAAMRAVKDAGLAKAPPGPNVARIEDHLVPARDATALPMRVYCDVEAPEAALLWLHGGGFTLGNIASFDTFCRHLARRTRAIILSLEYRLAPEFGYPVPLHDAVDSIRWCLSETGHEELGGLPFLIGGDSAGGNLATVAVRLLRDEAAGRIAGQILAYPCTDDVSAESVQRFDSPFLALKELSWFYDQYLPAGPGRLDPDVSPLRAPDLNGMPPTLLITAEHDILTEQGEAYGRRLAEGDVPVTMLRYAGLIHGFLSLDPFYQRQAGNAMDVIGAFVRERAAGRTFGLDADPQGTERVD